MLQLREIHHGERGLLPVTSPVTYVDEIIHDLLPDLDGGQGGILSKRRQPVGVIPANARLRLLGGDQIIRIIRQHQGIFQRGHQTRVESNEIILDARILQRRVDTSQAHGATRCILFVIAITGQGTAAVIPEDQHVAVGRIILCTILNKLCQGRGLRHGITAHVFLEADQLAALDLIDLILVIADNVIRPFLTSAGVNDEVYVTAKVRLHHLLDVRSRHAVLGFQIRAAKIHHERDHVLAVPKDRRILFPGACRHLRVQGCGGRAPVARALGSDLEFVSNIACARG